MAFRSIILHSLHTSLRVTSLVPIAIEKEQDWFEVDWFQILVFFVVEEREWLRSMNKENEGKINERESETERVRELESKFDL